MNAAVQKIKNYFIESFQELKRVVWPTRSQTINHTLIVIFFSIAVAVFLGALDMLFNFGVQRLLLK